MTKHSENNAPRFLVWMKELRAPFFTAVLIPVFLGTAVAWFQFGIFDATYFALSLVGSVCINAGTNLANDYFDYKSGCDSANVDFVSPFSGGSGLLPRGVLNPRKVYLGSLVCFFLAGVVGAFLAWTRGPVVLLLGLIGVLSGYFYTTQLATRGIGEFIVGLNCGPLIVLGSYYVQTQAIAIEPIVASVPIGILILAILWVNEIPDFNADSRAGKKTLVTRIGRRQAAHAYGLIMLLTYAVIALSVFLRLMPVLALVAFITLPLTVKAMSVAKRNFEDPRKLIPANATTVLVHLFTGLLLCVAYVSSRYLAVF